MNLQRFGLLVVAVIMLFGIVSWSANAQKKTPDRVAWEYREVINGTEKDDNALGTQGWEMVGFSVDSGNKYRYFKRVK